MKICSIIITIPFLSLTHFCLSQTSYEVGIGLTTEKDQRVFFNFNMSTKHKHKLNFRLTQGWILDEEHVDSESIKTSSNEDKVEIFWNKESVLQSKLLVGPEFQIKESNFSWGVEAVLGYRLEHYELTKHTHDINYISSDPFLTSVVYPPEKSERWISDSSHSLTVGLNGRVSLKAISTKSIGIKIFAALGLDYSIRVDHTLYEAEPSNEEPVLVPGLVAFTFPKNYFIPRARLGASIFLFQ